MESSDAITTFENKRGSYAEGGDQLSLPSSEAGTKAVSGRRGGMWGGRGMVCGGGEMPAIVLRVDLQNSLPDLGKHERARWFYQLHTGWGRALPERQGLHCLGVRPGPGGGRGGGCQSPQRWHACGGQVHSPALHTCPYRWSPNPMLRPPHARFHSFLPDFQDKAQFHSPCLFLPSQVPENSPQQSRTNTSEWKNTEPQTRFQNPF